MNETINALFRQKIRSKGIMNIDVEQVFADSHEKAILNNEKNMDGANKMF